MRAMYPYTFTCINTYGNMQAMHPYRFTCIHLYGHLRDVYPYVFIRYEYILIHTGYLHVFLCGLHMYSCAGCVSICIGWRIFSKDAQRCMTSHWRAIYPYLFIPTSEYTWTSICIHTYLNIYMNISLSHTNTRTHTHSLSRSLCLSLSPHTPKTQGGSFKKIEEKYTADHWRVTYLHVFIHISRYAYAFIRISKYICIECASICIYTDLHAYLGIYI